MLLLQYNILSIISNFDCHTNNNYFFYSFINKNNNSITNIFTTIISLQSKNNYILRQDLLDFFNNFIQYDKYYYINIFAIFYLIT
jgi:hypothetical protein